MMRKITLFFTAVYLLTSGITKADEGMWLLDLIHQINYAEMKEMGCELTPEQIYSTNKSSLKDAIVIFGRGCTGEIISDEGLILTNHHCGYGAIQYHSSVEHDYLKDGFWAKTKEEEIPTPNLSVTFLVRVEDVTKDVLKKVKQDMTADEREEAINKESEKIKAKATKGNHYDAIVKSYYSGNRYYLLVYEVFPDVRFVGAPPSSIGKFGHDTDNWMWPRHTCDFSMFRVYMGKDGKPAEYSKDNVPYKPKHFLPISLKGVDADDFTMILGYPGGTQRYMTSFGVKNTMDVTNTNRVKIRGIRQEIIMKDMEADPKVRIQYASKYARSSNYWKFSIGQNKGLDRLNVIAKKQALEKKFQQWAQADAKRKAEYGEALKMIEDAYNKKKEYDNARQYLSECLTRGTEFINLAGRSRELYKLLENKAKNTKEIEAEVEQLKQRANDYFKDYNAPTDKKVAVAMFDLYYNDIDEKYHPGFFADADSILDALMAKRMERMQKNSKTSDKMKKHMKDRKMNDRKGKRAKMPAKLKFGRVINEIFKTSVFVNKEKYLNFLSNPEKDVLDNDLGFQAALSAYEKADELHQKVASYNDELAKGQRLFIDGLMKMQKDRKFYPDANFTMRLTYGTVGDYKPRDAVHYDYYTTFKGVMEKEDPNNWEFEVPKKLKELYKNKDYGQYGEDGVMKVCFISNNDITGGNSGSPVLNGKGELIGLAFDGNWEAMSGDIAFEPELQRCINVDIRYLLFIIDKFAGADNLIKEMKIVK